MNTNTNTTRPAPKTLTLKKETLRRLTPGQLRLAVGGAACDHPCPSDGCGSRRTDGCWTWNCASRYPNC